MLAPLLVALSLGLSNFAASVGIGVGGIDRHARLRFTERVFELPAFPSGWPTCPR